MNNTEATKRTYKPFPYLEVLTSLMGGNGYEQTAKKHGYFEDGKADPTKSFRAHLHRARNVGFKHEGKLIKFPAFTREGKPVFGKGRPNSIFAKISANGNVVTPNAPAPKAEKQNKAKSVVTAKNTNVVKDAVNSYPVRFRTENTRGRKPNFANSVVIAMDGTGKFATLSIPKSGAMVPIDELLKALTPMYDSNKTNTNVNDSQPVQVSQVENEPVNDSTPELVENKDLALEMAKLG